MEIYEVKLEFNGNLRVRRSTRRIIIHHSASPDVSAETIHSWHLGRGWAGIGYHYVIRSDGKIERGRPENTLGAHAGKEGNPDSIGICLLGNFSETVPTEQQLQSLIWLIRDIKSRYGNLAIQGHREIMQTACPGDNFPWDEVNRMLKGEEKQVEQWKLDIINESLKTGLITTDHNADDPADKWFVLAVALNLYRLLKQS